MSGIRSGLVRATRVASRSSVFTQAARPISTTARLYKREIISEKQIPVSSYTPDAKGSLTGSATGEHYTIPVRPDPEVVVPGEVEVETVTPMSQQVYDSLPPTMQKMSVFGKVVIVTG
jgi:hypothetical protein